MFYWCRIFPANAITALNRDGTSEIELTTHKLFLISIMQVEFHWCLVYFWFAIRYHSHYDTKSAKESYCVCFISERKKERASYGLGNNRKRSCFISKCVVQQ